MGATAAAKIKGKADELEKALNKSKAEAEKETDELKKKALLETIASDAAFLFGWREAEKEAGNAPAGQETKGIGVRIAEEQKIVDNNETALATAKAQGNQAEIGRLTKAIDLETTTIAGKKAASDFIFS
jgi:histidinol-phosphate/aromatic aminotransferase/cobyric acid decarboxylase-like protein